MNKTLIFSLLIGGICGNLSTPMAIQPVTAAPLPQLERSLAAAPATIEVLNPGAEPRRELKFRPAVNSKQTMVMTMGMSMDMTMGDSSTKISMPKMVIKTDLTVQKVDPNGDIYYKFGYGDIKVVADKDTPPAMVASIQESLKGLVGIRGDIVMNSYGKVKSKNLILSKKVDPAIKETLEQFNKSIDQISTQFPSGMLGMGAKWQVNDSIKSGGITVNQSSVHEIIEISDIGMTIQTKITQSALPQDIKRPNLGKDIKSKLTSLNSSGAGQYQVRFDSLLPISGKLLVNSNSKMSIQISPKEPPTNIVNNMAIDLNISDK